MSGWLHFRLIQLSGAAVSVLPSMREGIGGAQLVARREKKGSAGAVRDAKLAQRVHHRLHAAMVGRQERPTWTVAGNYDDRPPFVGVFALSIAALLTVSPRSLTCSPRACICD